MSTLSELEVMVGDKHKRKIIGLKLMKVNNLNIFKGLGYKRETTNHGWTLKAIMRLGYVMAKPQPSVPAAGKHNNGFQILKCWLKHVPLV